MTGFVVYQLTVTATLLRKAAMTVSEMKLKEVMTRQDEEQESDDASADDISSC